MFMLISLHKQATTTPKIRAAIQASTEPAWMVAERYGVSGQTVWKWRNRDHVHDRSHTPHRLQTTLTPAQEAVAVVLRKSLLLPLDDLLSVVREFLNPHVSRSGLDRYQHGLLGHRLRLGHGRSPLRWRWPHHRKRPDARS
jgi:transposase-like protein